MTIARTYPNYLQDVYRGPDDTAPPSFYGPTSGGPGAIAGAVVDALAGAVTRLAVCYREPNAGPPVLLQAFALGRGEIDGYPRLRWCGEAFAPDGVGSHTVYDPSYRLDPVVLACSVAGTLYGHPMPEEHREKSRWIFRLPDVTDDDRRQAREEIEAMLT